jgi:hypothetical protein
VLCAAGLAAGLTARGLLLRPAAAASLLKEFVTGPGDTKLHLGDAAWLPVSGTSASSPSPSNMGLTLMLDVG